MSNSDQADSPSAGARWVRAALQVNPFAYVGKNAPKDRYATEHDYNNALLDQCVGLGIELIAVTDHWSVSGSVALLEAAEARGIAALPGFEANTADGHHLLVLFERGTSVDAVNAAIGVCGAEPGCDNGTAGKAYADIMREMSSRGALVVPAHANIASSGLLTGRGGIPLQNMIKNDDLHAIGISPGRPAAADQAKILKGTKPFDRPHKLATVYADDVCHPDTLAAEGATTWFKVSAPCLESLRHAVRTPQTRVRLQDPGTTNRVLFKSLSWTGGFLDDVEVHFSDDLTAFIGGRGTGKSTIIESLRHLLGLEPLGEDTKRDHYAIVKKVLGTGTVIELVVEAVSPKPGRYTIKRTIPNPPVVLDAAGTRTQLTPDDVTGSIEIFGQHELAEVAQSSRLAADMVMRFSGNTDNQAMKEIRRGLGSNREQLAKLEVEQADLEEELADIPRRRDRLAHFKDAEWPKKLMEQQRLSDDRAVIKEGRRRLKAADTAVQDLVDSDQVAKLQQEYEQVDESPQAAHLQAVVAATQRAAAAVESAIATMTAAIKSAHTEVDATETAWDTDTEEQRTHHAEVIRTLKAQGHDPDLYIATTDRLKDLRLRAKERPTLAAKHASLSEERQELLGRLVAADTTERKALAAAVRKANVATGKAVVVKPIVDAERRELELIVEHHVQGSRKALLDAVNDDQFSPESFVRVAREGRDALAAAYNFSPAQSGAILEAGEPFLRRLEEVVIGQAVEVTLDVSPDRSGSFRSLADLSKGQRATALLLLLLGAAKSPLIVDQPEDDLDNRFVYDGLVMELRKLKGKRQIIVSTHNANVPVLGDAELIVTLEGDGHSAHPNEHATGSLDNSKVRKMAEHLLEGGREAFEARRHLYGF